MNKFLKKFYWVVIVLVIVALDQFTKFIVANNLELREKITVIPCFFSITHIHNEGIAFGILSDYGTVAKIIVAVLTLLMIIVAIMAIVKKWVSDSMSVICVSFIIGGGIGNLIDRIVLQYVVDFFAFTFWGNDFAIFNVADIFVTVGTFLFIVYFLFFDKTVLSVKESEDGNQEI